MSTSDVTLPSAWDTTTEPSAFDPADWFGYVTRITGRAVPPVPPLVILSVINAPMSDVHIDLVERRYGRRAEDYALSGHPVAVVEHNGQTFGFAASSKGSYSAGAVDELAALGARRIIVLNVGAATDEQTSVGDYIVAASALRDEGVSHNYVPPGRFVQGSPELCKAIHAHNRGGRPRLHDGSVWTNTAHFRLSLPRLRRFREEGCLALDNEVAGAYAVGQARGIEVAAIVFVGLTMAADRIEVPEVHGPIYDQARAEEHFDLALRALLGDVSP